MPSIRAVMMLCAVTCLAACGGGGGGDKQPVDDGNPAPTISALSPATIDVGNPDLTLTVRGAGYVAGSVVRWNGKDLATSFASATSLTAKIAAADLAIAGSAQVSVSTPAPGG